MDDKISMIEITSQMSTFKEAIRHVWNSYFSGSVEPMSAVTQQAFLDIERSMLKVLVLAPYHMELIADEYRKRVLAEIIVKPIDLLNDLPIRIATRDKNGNMIWEEEAIIEANNAMFYFYDFFDWDPYGVVDLPFVRVQRPPLAAECTGKFALIEQRHCKFILDMNSQD